ncbi:MAG: DUF1735 domain-containing protein [Haliscomenobacter sp.]|nr:DUF1735 domain-containing protein [Haliscomenobacter sp.]
MKNLFKIVLFTFLALSFNSCLEDDPITDYTSIDPIITIPNANWPSVNAIAPLTLEVSTTPSDLDLYVRVSWENKLDRDLTVNFELDPAAISEYNAKFGTEYVALNADALQLPSPFSVVIPAGQREAKISVKLLSTKVDLSKSSMVAFRIKDAGSENIASNFRRMIFPIALKNKYDGRYEVTGTMRDVASASLTGYFPMNYDLITLGPGTVDGFDPDVWEDFFVPIRSGASLSGYGSFAPIFEFDPATNKIKSVINHYGQPAGNGRYGSLDPSGENMYDPATKTIKVKFFMHQPASVPDAPHIRVYFDWTMKYKGQGHK